MENLSGECESVCDVLFLCVERVNEGAVIVWSPEAEGLMLVCEGNYRKYLMPRHAYKLMKGTKIGDVLMLTDFKPTKSREAITCPLLPDEIQKFLQEQCVPKFQTTTLTFTALQEYKKGVTIGGIVAKCVALSPKIASMKKSGSKWRLVTLKDFEDKQSRMCVSFGKFIDMFEVGRVYSFKSPMVHEYEDEKVLMLTDESVVTVLDPQNEAAQPFRDIKVIETQYVGMSGYDEISRYEACVKCRKKCSSMQVEDGKLLLRCDKCKKVLTDNDVFMDFNTKIYIRREGECEKIVAFRSVFETVLKKRDVQETDLDDLFANKLKIEYYEKKLGLTVTNITIV